MSAAALRPDAEQPAPVAALTGVAQRFGRQVVLRSVDLELPAGTIVGLVGANGAGKTTLFSILAGLLQPDAGERHLFGSPADEVDAAARARLAYVAHAPQLYAGLSARENLALFADLRRACGLTTRPADEVLLALGLPLAVLDRPLATHSRGMAQRVALARALAGRPELLLLDEPFTALDARGREQLAQVLLAERARGAAILLSSHDFDTLLAICDRVVLLERGALVRSADHQGDRAEFRRSAAAIWQAGPDDPVSPAPDLC
ncbi:MAG: ATP-binding cassette domain-containing protein [Nannocystis sp.]|uniref:ABC transporter ATP-binding protein n=1 Tax=Nannocystis sp. TaxID=1962667 RepID=UPI002425BEF8|nr:ATP-binding cassette domain-containing protein [Nannocystis sp.]MBK9757676.1 ATP-binding cassette domain-containing protein [Nannocystis sp.]